MLKNFIAVLVIFGAMFVSQDSYGANVSASLKNRMNYLIAHQGIVSSNIANVTTPKYLAKELKFSPLRGNSGGMKISRTNGKHLAMKAGYGDFKIIESRKHMRHDGNSVKMDEEMLKLQNIQMNYRLVTRLQAKHAAMQRMVVSPSAR